MSADVTVLQVGQRPAHPSSWVVWTGNRRSTPDSASRAPAHHGLMLYGSAHLLRLAPKWTTAGGEPLALVDGALQDEAAAVTARVAAP